MPSRRNLNGYKRTTLALRLEEVIKERAKANQYAGINQHSLPQNSAEPSQPIETREEIAKLAGVSRDSAATSPARAGRSKGPQNSANPCTARPRVRGEIFGAHGHQCFHLARVRVEIRLVPTGGDFSSDSCGITAPADYLVRLFSL